MSILRTAHGSYKDGLLVAEREPTDELPSLNAEDTEQGLAIVAQRGKPFAAHNQAAKGRKPKLAAVAKEMPTSDPRYQRALRSARRYVTRRCRELAVQHGGYLGAGPSAMMANAGYALAASRVMYELAAETLDPKLFAAAAKLADSARMQELTAVGLAAREAESRNEEMDPLTRRRLENARLGLG